VWCGHPVPGSYGGRAIAPTRDEIAAYSARYGFTVDAIPTDVERAVLGVDLVGDVADVTLAGHDAPFDDLFWDGEPWTIDLTRFAGTGELELEVRVTAFNPTVSIRLIPRADQLGRQHGPVAVVHAAEIRLTLATTIALNDNSSTKLARALE
jgi:beta-galactosidase